MIDGAKIQINYGLGDYYKSMDFNETKDYDTFLNILPPDWQESIMPFWEAYKDSTKCYVIFEHDKPIAGGLVFSKCSPDILYVKEEADEWFDKGYLYLGYIYVLENKRGQNLGSLWLLNLKKANPNQKYWLTIEDSVLHEFYAKNGFVKIKTIYNDLYEEIVYAFNGNSE